MVASPFLQAAFPGRCLSRCVRAGKRIATFGALTEEQVAAELLNLDRQAHLTRTGGIW